MQRNWMSEQPQLNFMDDTQDKIRRNLVAISSGILLASFLKIELTTSPKLLGIAEITSISPLRFWFAILFLLLYFIVRYRFSDEHHELKKALDHTFFDYAAPSVTRYSIRHLQKDIMASRTSSLLRIPHFLVNFHRPGTPIEAGMLAPPMKALRLTPTRTWTDEAKSHQSIWNCNIGCTAQWIDSEGQEGGFNGGHPAHVCLPRSARWSIGLRIWPLVMFYSRVGIKGLFPYCMALSATTIVVYRIFLELGFRRFY